MTFFIEAFNCEDAWWKTLAYINFKGDVFKVGRGSEITETKKIAGTIHIEHPEDRPLIHAKAPVDMKYVNVYALEYLWSDTCAKTEIYTYGTRIGKQRDKIIKRLKSEPNDRQCTIAIRLPTDLDIHEPPCLSILDFEILNGKLNMYGYFRSWDAYAGLPANIAGLQLFNEAMANEIGVETGTLTFTSKNMHVYQRVYKLVDDLFISKQKRGF